MRFDYPRSTILGIFLLACMVLPASVSAKDVQEIKLLGPYSNRLPSSGGFFKLDVSCTENFHVDAIYAGFSGGYSVNQFNYFNATVSGGPPLTGTIAIVSGGSYYPSQGAVSSRGIELLHSLQVEKPLAVAAGHKLRVSAQAVHTDYTYINYSALVTTVGDAICTLSYVD